MSMYQETTLPPLALLNGPAGNPPDIPKTLVEQLSKTRRRGTKGDEFAPRNSSGRISTFDACPIKPWIVTS